MNSLDVYNLYAAYQSVYEDRESLNEDVDYDLYEANRPEREMIKKGLLKPNQVGRVRNLERASSETGGSAGLWYGQDLRDQPAIQSPGRSFGRTGPNNLNQRRQKEAQKFHAHYTQKRRTEHKGIKNEDYDYDLYDVVLDHLLDEGYCDDVESAEVIMANMSEEWLDGILDEANRGEQRYLPGAKSAGARETRRNRNFSGSNSWVPEVVNQSTPGRRQLHQLARGVKKRDRPYGPGGWAASQRAEMGIST